MKTFLRITTLLMGLAAMTACTQDQPQSPNVTATHLDPAPAANVVAEVGKQAVLDLRISADGKTIVDAQGNEIARFAEGIQVKLAGTNKAGDAMAIPGCMCCTVECIAWDSNENCVKTYKSCTWDFDCGCKKD